MKCNKTIMNDTYRCLQCGNLVSTSRMQAGVNNRNHCPCCLWSRHLDLHTAGDRLSACRGMMQPVGLTCKVSAGSKNGELMIVHRCTGCGKLSLNRIAADDLASALLELLDGLYLDAGMQHVLADTGISLLNRRTAGRLYDQLKAEAAHVHWETAAFVLAD